MDYSPFDALGMDAQMTSAPRIKSSFKHAIFRRHPDRQTQESERRFPLPHQIKDARDFLLATLEDGTLSDQVREFERWPRTFFPQDASAPFKTPKLTGGFAQCPECQMVMRARSLAAHVSTHDRTLCPFCGECLLREASEDHARIAHQMIICNTCGDWLSCEDETYHHDFHCCPFCQTRLAKGALMAHFTTDHGGEDCEECPEAADLPSHTQLIEHLRLGHPVLQCVLCQQVLSSDNMDDHLEEDHKWRSCEDCDPAADDFEAHVSANHEAQHCPACYNNIVKTEIMAHLYTSHGFQRCGGCDQSPDDADHLENDHHWTRCPECGEAKQKESLQVHLKVDHEWLECPHCRQLESTEEHLEDHLRAHQFKQCMICSKTTVEKKFRSHLLREHGMRDCPFCDIDPLPPNQLRTHITESHRETQKCPQCSELHTEAGLPIHLRERHHWLKCSFCSLNYPAETQRQEHMKEEHDVVSCMVCHTEQLKEDLDIHLIREHEYVAKPPTGGNLKRKRTSDAPPVEGKSDFNAAGSCPDCGQHSGNLYAHRRRVHGYRKREHTVFKTKRVKCVRDGVDHSSGNQNRCKDCKAAKQNEGGL